MMNQEDLDVLVHDVRAPLNSISMNAELAKLVLETQNDPARLKELLEIILRQCQECNSTLEAFREQYQAREG